MRKIRATMLAVAVPLELVELATLILWIWKGIWWPWALGMCAIIAGSVWISAYYFKKVAYICPHCHAVFRPRFREAFFASHTLTTRRLSCTACGHKGFCVETCAPEEAQQE